MPKVPLHTLYSLQFAAFDGCTLRLGCNTCSAALQLYCLATWGKKWIKLYSMIHIYSAEKPEYIYAEQPSELSPKGDLLYLSTYPKPAKTWL